MNADCALVTEVLASAAI